MLVILALTRRMADTPAEEGARLDLVGTALSALGLGLVVYGILRSGTWGFVQPKPGAPEWLGLSPVIWLMLAGGGRAAGSSCGGRTTASRAARRRCSIRRCCATGSSQGGLTSFFFQYLLQAGLFFVVPLFLSVALGLSAIADRRPAAAAVDHAAPRRRRHSQGLPARVAAPRRPDRVPRAVRRHRRPGRRARRGRRTGDRDLADAARRPRRRCAGVAARERDRVVGARRAERRSRRRAEHVDEPRRVDRHRAGRAPCSSRR